MFPIKYPVSLVKFSPNNRHDRKSAATRVALSDGSARFPRPRAPRFVADPAALGARSVPHCRISGRSCGYKVASDGHDTRAIQACLGHRIIQNTTRYTALTPQRFKEFFRD
jgi:hypothetical protein